MALLGAVPLLAKPEARAIANIGFGSGMTAEAVLSHSGPRTLDTIEIEPAMAAGAYAFSPRVTRVFRDRRMAVHFEDAKSFFARHGKRYDVIVSEPSNPWVNGVASLFTAEFYRHASRQLAPDGIFVQWLQFYELNDRLLGSMFAALDSAFADYDVYQASVGDLVVMGVREGRVPLPGELPAREPAFLAFLQQVGISRREHLLVRRLGGKRELAPYFGQLAAPANSDFRPVVQLEAPRARYLRQTADGIVQLAVAPLPILEMLGGGRRAFIGDRQRIVAAERDSGCSADGAASQHERHVEQRLTDAKRCVVAPIHAPPRVNRLFGRDVERPAIDQRPRHLEHRDRIAGGHRAAGGHDVHQPDAHGRRAGDSANAPIGPNHHRTSTRVTITPS